MSEFYDEYTDDENDDTNPEPEINSENEISSISNQISKLVDKYNLKLEDALQEIQTYINNNSSTEDNTNNQILEEFENHEIINS